MYRIGKPGGKYPDGGLRLHECKNPGIGYGGHGLCGKQYRPTLFRRQGAFLPADAFSPGSYERPALFAEAGSRLFSPGVCAGGLCQSGGKGAAY